VCGCVCVRAARILPGYSISKKEVQPAKFQVTVSEYPNTHESYYRYMVEVWLPSARTSVPVALQCLQID